MNKSFTLIEILVVIVIIGILSGFIIVSMVNVSDKANVAKSQAFANSLRNSLLVNLISEWKLDGNVNDSWGTNNGIIAGAPAYKPKTDCVYGQCLDFNGTEDFINLASLISLSDEFTFSAWIFRDTNNTYDFMAGRSTNDCKIGLNSGNDKMFIRVVSGSSADNTNSDNVSIGKWHYTVITRDSNDKVDFYLDAGGAKRLFAAVAQVGSLEIDRLANDGSSHFFDGKMDNIAVYSQITSTFQIQQNYYFGLNKLFINSGIALEEYQQRLAELKNNLVKK